MVVVAREIVVRVVMVVAKLIEVDAMLVARVLQG